MRSAVVLLWAALLWPAATGLSLSDCPPHVPRDGNVRLHNYHCYYFELTSQHDFATAQRLCNNLGGTLPTVDDQDTQDFLYRTLRQDFRSSLTIWIGLRNTGQHSSYVWENGQAATYFNWASGLTTVVIQDNGCVALNANEGGTWQIFPCHYLMFSDVVLPFVCQIPISSECQVCGDLSSQQTCSDMELTFAPYIPCDASTPYCMNDVMETGGQRSVFKRCVNETTCRQHWLQDTSDNSQCLTLGDGRSSNDLQCHFCCHGNDCNRELVPAEETWFRTTTMEPPVTESTGTSTPRTVRSESLSITSSTEASNTVTSTSLISTVAVTSQTADTADSSSTMTGTADSSSTMTGTADSSSTMTGTADSSSTMTGTMTDTTRLSTVLALRSSGTGRLTETEVTTTWTEAVNSARLSTTGRLTEAEVVTSETEAITTARLSLTSLSLSPTADETAPVRNTEDTTDTTHQSTGPTIIL